MCAPSTLPPYEPAPFLFGVQGDFLDFGKAAANKFGLGNFDACFDRGGLVAVQPEDRPKYAANLAELLRPGGKLLLVATEHDPTFGPPHDVDEKEVRKLLGKDFEVQLLSREEEEAEAQEEATADADEDAGAAPPDVSDGADGASPKKDLSFF